MNMLKKGLSLLLIFVFSITINFSAISISAFGVDENNAGSSLAVPDPLNSITSITNGTEKGIFYLELKGEQPIDPIDYSVTNPSALYFDIEKATLGIPERTVSIYNDFCTTIHYYKATNEKNVVRIKFAMKKKTTYKLERSDDGKTLRIYFKNDLTSISTSTKNSEELLRFKGIPYGDWKMTYNQSNNMVSFTADRAVNVGALVDSATKFASRILVFAPGDGKITIEVYLLDEIFYKTKSVSGEMELTLSNSPFGFMTYSKFGTNSLATITYGKNKVPVFALDRGAGTYTVTAPGNFTKFISNVPKYDNLMSNYQTSVVMENGKMLTKVTFRILPTTEPMVLSNSNGTIKIRFMKNAVSPSQITVAIDAGHGGHDSGAVGYLNGATIYEKKVNLDVALRLDRVLRENGFKTILTRKTDVFIPLAARGATANHIDADFFISIHHNSAASASANGIMTLYKMYSASDLRPVTNKTIAELFQKNILRDLDRKDMHVSNRPELAVLRTTQMPALLMELGFLQNKSDLKQIVKYQYREKSARSLAVSVVDYFNKYQGSHLEVDTQAILDRTVSAVTWQKYQSEVPIITPTPVFSETPVTPTPGIPVSPETTSTPSAR